MSYTNKTTHYELPQYVATDKPKYLTDFNETMVAIDTQMYVNEQAAATADTKAGAAKDAADGAVLSITALSNQINGDPTDPSDGGLAGDVSALDGDVNTIQSLIGNGTPTTSNQTIIGAINAIEASIAPSEDAATFANSYSAGKQFARGGVVYEALDTISAGTSFASLTLNTDYKVADTLVKQIADVKGDIPTVTNGYVYTGTFNLSYTADGTKTVLEDLNAAAAKFLTDIQALADDVLLIPRELNAVNANHFAEGPSPLLNTATAFNLMFAQLKIDVGNSQMVNTSIILNTNGCTPVRATIGASTSTFANIGSDSNTHNVTLRCFQYKKVV